MIPSIAAEWPAPRRVRALQTLRTGGASAAPYDTLNLATHVGDAPETVTENRRRLREALQLSGEPVWLDQVHGTRVLGLPAEDGGLVADAAWTAEPGVVCAVLTADCLPVLFCADDGSAVAAAHAGWRGLAAGVLEATVRSLPVPPARLMAWMGAAIGPSAFEVGPEVRAAFVDTDCAQAAAFAPGREGRWLADIYALARARLLRAGLPVVYGGGACTYGERQRYFSYRRSARCGRMAALIWIEKS